MSPEMLKELIEEYKPVIKEVTPVLKEFLRDLLFFCREVTIDNIHSYMAEGFTKEEAILLTINTSVALTKVVESYGKK